MQWRHLFFEFFDLLSQFHVTLMSHSVLLALRLCRLVRPKEHASEGRGRDATAFQSRHADPETKGQTVAFFHGILALCEHSRLTLSQS